MEHDIASRSARISAMRIEGRDPFVVHRFPRTHSAADAHAEISAAEACRAGIDRSILAVLLMETDDVVAALEDSVRQIVVAELERPPRCPRQGQTTWIETPIEVRDVSVIYRQTECERRLHVSVIVVDQPELDYFRSMVAARVGGVMLACGVPHDTMDIVVHMRRGVENEG